MIQNEGSFKNMTDFLVNFAGTTVMSDTQTRLSYVTFAGNYSFFPDLFQTIYNVSAVDAAAATDYDAFVASVDQLEAYGGTTDAAGVLDYVRTDMLTPANLRPGSKRIVVFATDGSPSNEIGATTPEVIQDAEFAAMQLRAEDDVTFVFLRIGEDYAVGSMEDEAPYIYDTTSATLDNLLQDDFLCFEITETPTTSRA
jgi:hypothetical protein